MARIYGRRSRNVLVVKGIRPCVAGALYDRVSIEHPRRTKASAQTYFSRDEFGRSFSLSVYILPLRDVCHSICQEGSLRFHTRRLVSLQYSTIYPTSKIARDAASGFSARFLIEDACLSLQILHFIALGCFSTWLYDDESNRKVLKSRREK